MKECFKCKVVKPLSEFYKHGKMSDKHLNKCKECTKEDVRRHRSENLERIRAYDRARGDLPHRIVARKEYQKTDSYKISRTKALANWSKKHSKPSVRSPVDFNVKRRANTIVGNAVRDKRLIPWPICSLPDCDKKPEAHHPDYSRPLDVVWLCDKHHKEAHKLGRQIEREREYGLADHPR